MPSEQKLERAFDCIVTDTDPKDRRLRRVDLTPRARPVAQELRTIARDMREETLAGIGSDRHEQRIDLLLRIKANMLAVEPVPPSGKRAPARKSR